MCFASINVWKGTVHDSILIALLRFARSHDRATISSLDTVSLFSCDPSTLIFSATVLHPITMSINESLSTVDSVCYQRKMSVYHQIPKRVAVWRVSRNDAASNGNYRINLKNASCRGKEAQSHARFACPDLGDASRRDLFYLHAHRTAGLKCQLALALFLRANHTGGKRKITTSAILPLQLSLQGCWGLS